MEDDRVKVCENCIWFEQCKQMAPIEPCEWFMDENEIEDDIAAYEADLRERHKEYRDLVKEQQS